MAEGCNKNQHGCSCQQAGAKEAIDDTRRDLLRYMGVAAMAGAMVAADSEEAEAATFKEWFQTHYELMSEEEKKECIARLEKRYSEESEKKVTVSDGHR